MIQCVNAFFDFDSVAALLDDLTASDEELFLWSSLLSQRSHVKDDLHWFYVIHA